MPLIVVDVEADGPAPGLFSMVCFGAVVVAPPFDKTFYGKTAPITDSYDPAALAVSGFTREQHLIFDPPENVMKEFAEWLVSANDQPVFLSDNVAFDWQFINYYFHLTIGRNPFGFSGRRIGDIYSGLCKNMRVSSNWKKLRKTKHTHNPVDDATGNAEAFTEFAKLYGLKL